MKPSAKIVAIALLSGLAIACKGQPAFERKGNPTDDALARYAELTDTTLLRAPGLPVLKPSLIANLPSETNAAIVALRSGLLAEGIEMVSHRELFTLAVRPGWTNTPVATQIERIPADNIRRQLSPALAATTGNPQAADEIIAPGMIDFINADGNQVLQLYSELVNKTLFRSRSLPYFQLKLRTQTPLNRAGAIYIMRVMLALQGLAVVDDGDSFEEILPILEASSFTPRAPKRDPGEAVVTPVVMPDFGRVTGAEVVKYYAEATGQTAIEGADPDPRRILFKTQTPLTKRELRYALETVLKLNGLAIVQVDDKTIRLGRGDEAAK